jgi:hypothetical protein
MRKLAFILGCIAMLQMAGAESSSAHPHRRGGVTISVFYDALGPYGEWIAIGGGVYGWRPLGVAVGWRPYTIGHWVWTEYGWYWVSDEPWGWAVFHYGRWYYDDFYGWIWIPGYDWAPAWVEWRYGDDYIGWAPLGPYAVFSIHWGIHYRTRWYTPVHWWSFVHCRYISTPHLYRYIDRPENNTRYIGVTRTGGSVRYSGGRIVSRGPEPEYVQRRGNVRIAEVKVREVDDQPVERLVREGNREQIEVYRPRIIEHADDETAVVRPSRVREEAGRPLDLDTRKIDVRIREASRTETREMRRAEDIGVRSESGRTGVETGRDAGMLKGPVDDATLDREARKREGVQAPPDRRRDERSPERPPMRDEGTIRRQPDAGTSKELAPPRDTRERKRDESYRLPQREDPRIASPQRPARQPEYRSPERRSDLPRREAAPQPSTGRNRGGRGERGR